MMTEEKLKHIEAQSLHYKDSLTIELVNEIRRLQDQRDSLLDFMARAQGSWDADKKAIEKLRDALEFYADGKHNIYPEAGEDMTEPPLGYDSSEFMFHEDGTVARKALGIEA